MLCSACSVAHVSVKLVGERDGHGALQQGFLGVGSHDSPVLHTERPVPDGVHRALGVSAAGDDHRVDGDDVGDSEGPGPGK